MLYRIHETRRVSEEELRKSPHHIELLVDPSEDGQLILHSGEEVTAEDLFRTVSLLAVSSYQGMKEVPEYAGSAEAFKKAIQQLFADEAFWHEGEKDSLN